MSDSYFAHYGVKGMKWGVRRDLGKRSRLGANFDRQAMGFRKMADNAISKEDRQTYKNRAKELEKFRDKLYSSLSEKDIAQGKRAVKNRLRASVIATTTASSMLSSTLVGLSSKSSLMAGMAAVIGGIVGYKGTMNRQERKILDAMYKYEQENE